AMAHVIGVFFFPLDATTSSVLGGLALFLVLCWLNAGLFILAHDAMHGTLCVGNRAINRVVGQICLWVYAGFWFRPLNTKHHQHHRTPGSADDPDFHDPATRAFWPWYLGFFKRYFTWREALSLALVFQVYVWVLGAPMANMILFWAAPSILASAQLFYFGTYLPHRPSAQGFEDDHMSRSNAYPWLVSLLTCFHFGYHLEHHRYPYLPWWRLPEARTF
ncbi:MAG: fatty acid desaturase, partial [Alphaproteobacteria bacterium]